MSNRKVGLYIPTTGRANRQVTLRYLPQRWLDRTALVIDKREVIDYSNQNVELVTHNVKGMGSIRHFITKFSREEYVMMLDDDMTFYVRLSNGKLCLACPNDVGVALDWMVETLDKEKDVGETSISLAILNHTKTEDFYYNEKCGPVMCFRRELYTKIPHGFDKMPLLQADNTVTLGLLSIGYKTKVLYTHAFKNIPPLPEHKNTGCSGYRTPEMERKACLTLKSLYPDYITLREIKEKSSTKDYSLYGRPMRPVFKWKKAYDDAIAKKANNTSVHARKGKKQSS